MRLLVRSRNWPLVALVILYFQLLVLSLVLQRKDKNKKIKMTPYTNLGVSVRKKVTFPAFSGREEGVGNPIY